VVHSLKNKISAWSDDISPYLPMKCVPQMLKPHLELVNESNRGAIFSLTLKKNQYLIKFMKKNANNYHAVTKIHFLNNKIQLCAINELTNEPTN
jgi:hypothetical protein